MLILHMGATVMKYSAFPQSSSIIETSSLDYLVLYPGHSLLGVSYPSAEKQSVYSTAQADRKKIRFESLQEAIKSINKVSTRKRAIFWVFDMNRPGIEPGSPGPLANTTHYANVRYQ